MGILRWFVTFVVSLLVLAFSVSNLELVGVRWSPFHPSYDLPLYAVILAALSLGFFWGGLMVWFSGSKTRSNLRQANKDIKRLEKDVEEARKSSGTEIEISEEI
ncbi:MAG: lipopolysaccharide assembly protein LapA domain-containing protein [Bdellovibrionales bacterium]